MVFNAILSVPGSEINLSEKKRLAYLPNFHSKGGIVKTGAWDLIHLSYLCSVFFLPFKPDLFSPFWANP